MAKKKSKNTGKGKQLTALSPYRFMREKARNYPIGKCYIAPPDWLEAGMAHVIVTRIRTNGNIVMASFLVDTFCLGVKDAGYHENMNPYDFEQYLDNYKNGMDLVEISYNEAHNIIYGAMAFAEEGGIKPAKDFDPAGYILEEDTDDIPLIEYDFGKNGKHCLMVKPGGKEMSYLSILKNNLGENFEYFLPYDDDFEDDIYDEESYEDEEESSISKIDADVLKRAFANMSKWQEEAERHPDEQYTYQYPEYPQTLSVKNQFIADELFAPDNYNDLPREVIDRILALPKDEAAQDISNIILYTIGKTYKSINDDTIEGWNNSAIMHSMILLAQIQSDKSLDAVLEFMRQTETFADFHLGDLAPGVLRSALYACGKDNIPAIEEYLNQPGLNSYLRSMAVDALTMIIFNQPERRAEIIEVFRRLLKNMISNLPVQKACDGTFAGFTMGNLMDFDAKELIPEIKEVFATDCVDKTISGDCKTVIKDIESGRGESRAYRYCIPNIYNQYDSIKKFMTQSE